jgi:AraC-like DNA-binding protein
MARPATLLNEAQLPLVGAVQAVHFDAGRRIRALIRKAIADNGISHSSLAHELGMDESHLSRALADDKGAHPSPAVYAAVLALDSRRILVGGLAAMCGCEAVEKRPDPEEENRKLRKQLRAAVEALSAALGESP